MFVTTTAITKATVTITMVVPKNIPGTCDRKAVNDREIAAEEVRGPCVKTLMANLLFS